MNLTEKTRQVMRKFVVTIDGPAGSGKSTTASILAKRLDLTYLDTGAMYRAVTLAALERGMDPENEKEVSELAERIELAIEQVSGEPVLFLDGRNVAGELRTPEVSRFVSPVSRHAGVRRSMVRLQRRIGARGGIVAEGRDTGSVVFPYANLKVFLTADIESRAGRRFQQLRAMGIAQDPVEIMENLSTRDRMDSGRSTSPLVRPAGALLVDTSNLTIEEQVDVIEKEARDEAGRIADLTVWAGEEDQFAAMTYYYRIPHSLLRGFFRVVFGLTVSGDENIRYRENYIFASNHVSYADPLVVGCALKREVRFLAKKELFRNRAFAWLIRTYHAIPVDRREIDHVTMKRIFDVLRTGGSILMFPEGTRSRSGELGDLKAGLGFTALNTGVGIIPICVTGTNRLLDCLLRRARLEVRIGPPIRVRKGLVSPDRKGDYRVLTSMAQSELRMLKDEAEV